MSPTSIGLTETAFGGLFIFGKADGIAAMQLQPVSPALQRQAEAARDEGLFVQMRGTGSVLLAS